MNENKLLEQLEILSKNEDRWLKDAEDRDDWNDFFHHQGKKEAFEKVKKILLKQI